MELRKLNEFNYYDCNEWMSNSQFKSFQKCEAQAKAEYIGLFKPEQTTALLVGSYVDRAVEGTLSDFMLEHPEMFKKDGRLKSDFDRAALMFTRIKADLLFSALVDGKKQVIRTGDIAGVPFKGKFDSLLSEEQIEAIVQRFPETEDVLGMALGAIVDLKTTKDFKRIWNPQHMEYESFIDAYGYVIQGAIYQELERQATGFKKPFIICAVTKEPTPDIGIWVIPQQDLDAALEKVKQWAPRYQAIKEGRERAVGCGKCAWCKSAKVIKKISNYHDLVDGEFEEEEEW